MVWIINIYWVLSVIISVTAFSGGWRPTFSALVTSLLSYFAGAGLRGILHGTRLHKLAGFLLAIVFVGVAYWVRTRIYSTIIRLCPNRLRMGRARIHSMLLVYAKVDVDCSQIRMR